MLSGNPGNMGNSSQGNQMGMPANMPGNNQNGPMMNSSGNQGNQMMPGNQGGNQMMPSSQGNNQMGSNQGGMPSSQGNMMPSSQGNTSTSQPGGGMASQPNTTNAAVAVAAAGRGQMGPPQSTPYRRSPNQGTLSSLYFCGFGAFTSIYSI